MTDWFDKYESYPVVEKSQIKWGYTKDFQVQGKYIVESLKSIISNSDITTDKELLAAGQLCYNLISWTKQMAIMGFTGFQKYVDELLQGEFEDKEILHTLQTKTFARWLENNRGFQKIGENYFTIIGKNVYYKKLNETWHIVEKDSVFDIMPKMQPLEDHEVINDLESRNQVSVYSQIYEEWKRDSYTASVPEDHYDFYDGESTPKGELNKSMSKISKILDNPVSLDAVIESGQLDIDMLEYQIKLSFSMVQFVQPLRKRNEHSIYLLRDCVMFNEIHKTLDAIEGNSTSCDHLIVCRDLLTNSKRRGGHWYFSQEALFFAYEKQPENYEMFYEEYSKILSNYEKHSSEFHEFIKKLAIYVDDSIPATIDRNMDVDIVDLGFQGSINILLKYVIDNHCQAGKKHKTVIQMTVLAEWFKGLYEGMYHSETYSLLTNIESLGRNELMYRYKLGSFEEGAISVVMGSKDEQQKSNTELLVSTMVTVISKKLELV